MKNKKSLKLIQTGVLCALGIVFMLVVRFSILPGAAFLEYDMGDISVILALLLVSFQSSVGILFAVALVQSLTVSAASSWEGFIMHFISTAVFVLILYLFTRKKKDIKLIAAGLAVAAVCQILIMIPLNLIFTPMYLGCPVEAVKELLLPAIIPFNAIKAAINSIMTIILYPVLNRILTKSHLV